MTWNWQQPNWPNFTWDPTRIAKAEQLFLVGGGVIAGTSRHIQDATANQIIIEALTSEAVTTSEIEGEILDRASVQSSVRNRLGLSTDRRRSKPAERGIAEMMVDLYQSFDKPLDHETLYSWHRMLLSGHEDLDDIGKYRSSDEPMQVISGRIGTARVHFEAPPSAQVPHEMGRFIDWFNETAQSSSTSLSALTRAGIAHLYFESIHPFEDGNGRIGRAVAKKSLAQSMGQPTMLALAATILARRTSYYQALEEANKRNEITNWLAWFAGIVLEAQERTTATIDFLVEKTKMLDRVSGDLNERQLKALLRIFEEGPNGFKGGLSASNYLKITDTSPATATRDLVDMTEKGVLKRIGEQRYTRYYLAIPIHEPKRFIVRQDGEIVES